MTKNINRIQFRVSTPEGSGRGYVHADDPKMPERSLFGREIAHLYWVTGDQPQIDEISVSPLYRHMGIATRMYELAQEHQGAPIRHSAFRTDDGDAWAKHVGGERPRRRLTR